MQEHEKKAIAIAGKKLTPLKKIDMAKVEKSDSKDKKLEKLKKVVKVLLKKKKKKIFLGDCLCAINV